MLADFIIILALILIIPTLVERALSKLGFARELRMAVMIGGTLWILLACGHGVLYSFFGMGEGDSRAYLRDSQQVLKTAKSGELLNSMEGLYRGDGRRFYSTFQGLLYFFTGGTILSMLALNAFVAFWGGVVLAEVIFSFAIMRTSKSDLLILPVIFAPSVVFWSSCNIKEALMYWAICQVFALAGTTESTKSLRNKFVWFIVGAYVGLHVRSHIMVIWIVAVLSVKMMDRRFFKYSIVMLLFLPLFLPQLKSRINFDSFDQNFTKAEQRMHHLIQRNRNSTFDYGERGPIPILSGLNNMQFRPFIWRMRDLRSVLTALEIWTISIGIMFMWLTMREREWSIIIRIPPIWAALLVLIPFWLFFTYTPNEGLLARQRIQLFPALMLLLAMPLLVRKRGSVGAYS